MIVSAFLNVEAIVQKLHTLLLSNKKNLSFDFDMKYDSNLFLTGFVRFSPQFISLSLSLSVNICILPLLLPLFLFLREVGSAAGDVWLE